MGSAYQGAGQYDKAVELFNRALEERPHAFWIYRSLAPTLVCAGRMDEALAAYAILRKHYPDLTLGKVREAMAFSPGFMEKMLDGLAKLGMPDK